VHRIPEKPRRISDSTDQRLLVTDANPIRKRKSSGTWNITLAFSFTPENQKKTSKGLSPIYMWLTINGQRLDQSIQRYVDGGLWSAVAGRVKGNTEQARQVNAYFDTLTGKVLKLEREMILDGIVINFDSFREKWLGIMEAPRMLMEIFQQHNDQMEALIRAGKDFSPGTLDRYNTCRDHVLA
jgi:hypothetical protein